MHKLFSPRIRNNSQLAFVIWCCPAEICLWCRPLSENAPLPSRVVSNVSDRPSPLIWTVCNASRRAIQVRSSRPANANSLERVMPRKSRPIVPTREYEHSGTRQASQIMSDRPGPRMWTLRNATRHAKLNANLCRTLNAAARWDKNARMMNASNMNAIICMLDIFRNYEHCENQLTKPMDLSKFMLLFYEYNGLVRN